MYVWYNFDGNNSSGGVIDLNMDFPDFEHFQLHFSTEDACAEALWAARWPNGFRCPRCHGSRSYPIISRKLYECANCQYQVSLIAGTVFENSHTPLTKWFLALYMISRPTGISAVSLQKMLQVTYKTAWSILSKLRYAMSQDSNSRLLSGLVRMNTAIYQRKNTSDLTKMEIGEHHVMVGASVNEAGEPKHIKIKRIPKQHTNGRWALPSSIHDFTQCHVDPLTTDVQNVNGHFHRQRFQPLVSLVKQASQWIRQTFIAIGPKHLQAYLDEFCYRRNAMKSHGSVFHPLLGLCASQPALTYKQIIQSRSHHANHPRSMVTPINGTSTNSAA
jgi:transposase-like protein